ncbi:MAG: endolytic transglycosylase MltG [Acidisphaera sp.]|nr:endolytic transglycosylase MltG [Acidisphaera sp.]
MTRTRGFGVAFLVLLALSVTVGAAARLWQQVYEFPGPLMAGKTILIPRGTPKEVGAALKDAGAIRNVDGFWAATLLTRSAGPLHAGEFAFPAGAPLRDVLAILRTAKPVAHKLTIREGLTSAQIALLLADAESMVGDAPLPPEGHVLPDTYAYEHGASRSAVLGRATAAMDRALARVWAGRTPDLALADPEALLTLASIVEKETAKPDERPLVAAVFLNRLRLGMKLQADPTVIYAATGGAGMLDRKLTRADLDAANPYNTYQTSGLPPGPICSPGLQALEAVAHPAQSDMLYFVADGTGGHVFARTVEEHNRNVAHWRAINAAAQANDKGPGEPNTQAAGTSR